MMLLQLPMMAFHTLCPVEISDAAARMNTRNDGMARTAPSLKPIRLAQMPDSNITMPPIRSVAPIGLRIGDLSTKAPGARTPWRDIRFSVGKVDMEGVWAQSWISMPSFSVSSLYRFRMVTSVTPAMSATSRCVRRSLHRMLAM